MGNGGAGDFRAVHHPYADGFPGQDTSDALSEMRITCDLITVKYNFGRYLSYDEKLESEKT